jgi:hypothetical protein
VEKVDGRCGGERAAMERKASGSAQWRRRPVERRHAGGTVEMADGMRGRSLAGSRHCGEFFLENYCG